MKQLVCEACGSKELIKQDGVFVCQSCDTKYSVEEAAKMTNGIDTSASLEKALKNARRAMERKDYEQAEKFYGIVLMEEPENWEATFYSTYAKAMGKSISEAANLVTNSIKTVLKDLKKLDDAVQQEKAIDQIGVDLLELCEAGYNSAIGDYNSEMAVYSTNVDFYADHIYRAKASCADNVMRYTSMLAFFGKELISEFGENEYTITKIVLFYETERKALDESLFGSIFNAQFDNEGFINYLQESNCEHRKWLDKLNELTKAESSETIEAGESSEATENEKKPEPSRSDTILGCLIIIVIIVAVICIGRCACSGPSETLSETNEKIEENKEQRAKADSLQNEESYALGKKLFAEKKYDEALPVLKKINNKYEKYNEVENMIKVATAATVEMAKVKEMATKALALTTFINDKSSVNSAINKNANYSNLDASGKVMILSSVMARFATAAEQIKECENFQKNEYKKLASQAKNKLKNDQRRDFPLLRKEYAKILADILWRDNIEVKAAGNGNSRLEFTSGIFANNANIDDFQNKTLVETKVKDSIKFFRFKKVAYKWYGHDENYTYYEYDTPADDAEISLSELKK
jgi:uncharacterized Zn finger protein (UPF0148 family)